MQDDERLIKKRFEELSRRASAQQRYTYSEFLTLAEQDVLSRMRFDVHSASVTLCGGAEGAERKIAQFGSGDFCGYDEKPPIDCVSITPLSQKFADQLTHRDFLGALMALGVRRSVLGDIVLHDNGAYLFCLDAVSDFIVSEFKQVRRTSVKCAVIDGLPDIAVKKPETVRVNVASERLDAVIAAVYRLPRGESQALFAQGKVFINSHMTENTSLQPDSGDVVSVRGHGRFIYEGVAKGTKKGRLFVSVRIY